MIAPICAAARALLFTAAMRMLVMLAVLAASAPARANCKSDKEVMREGDTRCADVSASMGGAAGWLAPGLVDQRVDVFGITLVGHDPAARTWRFSLGDVEWLGGTSSHGAYLDATYIGSAIGFGYGRDYADWGWYAMLHAFTHADDTIRLVTPSFGLRLGRFDRAALLAEARFDDVFLIDISHAAGPSVARDFDLRARATAVVRPWMRLEARARVRDATFGNPDAGRHVRDAMGALGVELAVAGRDGFRVAPVFLGVGTRAVLADSAMPTSCWQLLGWLEVEFSVNSARTVW